jgi:uncharacterized SAM-binding protein YcdF (DUF218 family)
VRLDRDGRLQQGPLARRLDAAAGAYAGRKAERPLLVVASGGRRWGDLVEADVMACELARRGVPEWAIVRERCSLTTRDNARFTAQVLARRATVHVDVVTCEWHLPRAIALFRGAGMCADGVAAPDPGARWPTRMWRRGREGLLRWLQTR